MVTPFFRPAAEPQTYRICQAFQILLRSEAPTYLNSDCQEKLQFPQWLISATLPEFNHSLKTAGSRCEDPAIPGDLRRLWPVNPSPRRRLRAIWIPSRQ